MTHLTKLRRLFSDITLATLIAQTGACTEERHDGVDRRDFDLTVSSHRPSWVAHLRPDPSVDYLAFREPTSTELLDGGTLVRTWRVESETGDACGGALDVGACMASLDTIGGGVFVVQVDWPYAYQLVYTRGDEVRTVPDEDGGGVLPFLGEVDSPEEAALVHFVSSSDHPSSFGPNARATEDGFEIIAITGWRCDPEMTLRETRIHVSTSGAIEEGVSAWRATDQPCVVPGRLTEHGPRVTRARHANVGAFLAQMATHEAASVPAFTRLAQELDALGAPSALAARARAAAEDEVRHAELVRALARTYGVDASLPDTSMPLPLRPATEVAIENAVEGCVRETFAALLAMHQSTAARDVRVRTVMAAIAEDELRHAALSYDVHDWLGTILSGDARAHAEDARRTAIDALIDGDHDYAPSLRIALGLPDASTHARYAIALRVYSRDAATAA